MLINHIIVLESGNSIEYYNISLENRFNALYTIDI